MEIKYKIWLENKGEVIAGNGKISLLKMIDELGSIQKAAEKMGLSYRHAWGMIKKMERRAGFKLIRTAVGGKEGGGANLTARGQELVQKYLALRTNLDKFIKQKFNEEFKSKAPKAISQLSRI
ncbi:MAG: winged helix-turn-helix domain-containing protein [Thermodesulfobacteriota bacterium]